MKFTAQHLHDRLSVSGLNTDIPSLPSDIVKLPALFCLRLLPQFDSLCVSGRLNIYDTARRPSSHVLLRYAAEKFEGPNARKSPSAS